MVVIASDIFVVSYFRNNQKIKFVRYDLSTFVDERSEILFSLS